MSDTPMAAAMICSPSGPTVRIAFAWSPTNLLSCCPIGDRLADSWAHDRRALRGLTPSSTGLPEPVARRWRPHLVGATKVLAGTAQARWMLIGVGTMRG